MNEKRRDFLKKALASGAAAGVATSALANSFEEQKTQSGVAQGKAHKKEVLYHTSKQWEKYYKIAY
ncbi:MAG: twin-arginine translocation signal domain-containing protein [Campylobacter sp.]|nr:twin-arginine translocation signal domain-containing protein [Campylobacter sp.]